MGIVFCEPPPDGRGEAKTGLKESLRTIQARPGEWARIGPYSRSSVYIYNREIRAGLHGPGYDSRPRQDDGQWFVWARYVGNCSEAAG